MNADFYKLVRTIESLTEEKPESKKLENGKSVLKESKLKEMDKSQHSGDRGGESSGDPYAKGGQAKPIKFKDMAKHAEKTLNKSMDKAHKKDVKEQQQGVAEGTLEEVAPPGAKAERMVKHIKAGYAKDGKLTDVEKRKAYGAAWKAHNRGQVEEGEVWRPGMPPPPNPDMGSSLSDKEQKRVVSPVTQTGQAGQATLAPLDTSKNVPKPVQVKPPIKETDKKKKQDRLPLYQESLRYKTINKLIREEFDLDKNISIEEKDIEAALGAKLYNELQAVKNNEAELSEELKDALFNFYKNSGELPVDVRQDEQSVTKYILDRISSMESDNDKLSVSENVKHKGTRYGGAAQADDQDDEDGEQKSINQPEEKRGRGRPRKDSGDANTSAKYSGAKDLQSMIVGNVPKKQKSLEKLPATKHKLKG